MNRRVLFFMIAVAMGLLLAAFAAPRAAPASQALPQTQVILEPVAMAWVSSAEPDTNFGGRGYIWVGYGHGTGDTLSALRGLVKFDLSGIPSDAIITEARLYAAIIDAQGLPDHFVYYAGYALDQMTRWTEDGVTWNNHPNAAWGTAYLDISATFGQVSWDVTTIVQGMIDGRWVNNGFYLMRENDQTDPQEHARLFQNLALVVNYESPTPTPTPEPLVRIDKADLTDPVYAGDEVQYTISVRNLTDRPLLRMMLQDTIPDGATFVEASGSGSFDGDRTVTWLIRILPANASRTLQLTLRTSPDTPDGTELINRAVASYRCQGGDEGSQICFQEATETTTVRRQPTPTPISVMCLLDEAGDTFAMAAEFTPGPRGTQARICPPSDEDWYKFPVDEGDIIEGRLYDLPAEYYIELWRGDGSHVGTFVPDELADVEFSWRVEAGRGGWWRVRVWSPSDAFSPYPYSLMIQVHAPTPTPTRTTTPTSTPTMTPTPTPTPTTRSRAELTINKRVDTSEPIRPDQDVEYVISVHNSGDAPARQVEIRDIIPPRTTFVSASPAATYANGVVTWPVRDRLNPGAQLNYRVTLHVAADVPDGFVLTNRAEARAEDVPRVRDEASITVSGLPQLHVSKHPMSVPARGGEDLTYEIVVSNEGEAPAYNVVVWDEDLPAEFVSAGPNGVYDRSERTLTWPTIPVLNPGESRTYHVTVHIADDVSHNVIITNYAYAEADNADRAMARSSMNTWNPPDLIADGLEVTQGIQDLNNSVVLIKGKRTYVRFYVHSDGDPISGVTARLWRWADGRRLEPGLAPSNPGGTITVVPNPDRADLNDSFYFELPDSWVNENLIAGTQIFEAEVNYGGAVVESNYDNNVARTGVLHFKDTPLLKVRLYRVAYRDDDGHLHTTDSYHYPYIENWLRQAYPVPDVRITDASSILGASHWVTKGTCSEINSVLADEWTQDGSPADVIYFAISDGIPYGCSPVPGNWGTGAAWPGATFGWDFDGSMADWYAGHEIGHTRGMDHVQTQLSNLCNNVAPPSYEPYQAGNGRISPDTTGPGAQYGFNVDTLEIYPYWWKDVMTYCDYEWVSGYTYEKIHDFIVGQAEGMTAQGVRTEGERLLVIGLLDPEEDTARLTTVSRVVETWPLTTPSPGPYSLRLLDGGGGILAQHAFTPTLESAGRGIGASPKSMGRIYLVVPWVSGTAYIGIWHGDQELVGRDVSAHAPTVTVTYPNGGEEWGSQPVTVTWMASDADGDPLRYMVQYSVNGGNTWRVLARRLSDPFYTLDPAELPGSDQALIRVAANDGVNTGRDVSDATFQVANKPPGARIIAPASGQTFIQGQPIVLRGVARDREDGQLTGQALTWISDRDGPLGIRRVTTMLSPSVGTHRITLTATDGQGLTATDEIQIEVLPAPPTDCVERLHNGDFESGDLRGWQRGGMPAPFVSDATAHGGNYALILGAPGDLPDRPSLSFVRQYVRVPENASQAMLSFWYKVRTLDPGTDHDWFGAFVLDPQGEQAHRIVLANANSDWNQALYDLRPFAGQTVGIGFFVRNDGQAGQTWAFVDDVSIYANGSLPPSKPGACWLSEQPDDYAPAGLPDFDQRQDLWQVPGTDQWSHDGPAAVADLLWWRDSAEEPGTTTPPDVSDGYPLVGSYGAWDDHDPRNVPPLIADLATRMNTNGDHPGTDLDDLMNGLNAYLAAKGLADDYTVTVRRAPSFDWVREEVKQNRQVLLLLGFWELQPSGWRRLGGHYVAAAGASCDGDRIALSDPFRNYAEAGWAGQVAPPGPHGHMPDPPHVVHNDAAYVSHDVYGIMRTAGGWGPQGYARSYAEIANFAELNFAPALEPSRAGVYLGGEVVTLVDYALVLAPRSDLVTLKLSPAVSRVRAGETFLVEMEILAGDQPVDGVSAYLNFDPNVLRVVDEEGNPATRVIPGTTLSNVTLNRAINALGRVNFVAQGDATAGRFTVAIVRFQAITATESIPLTWSVTAPRQSDVTLGGGSVLDSLREGRVVIRPGARLTGQATMQGRPTPPDPSWQVPLLLSLSRPGESGPAYLYGTASNQGGAFAMPDVVAPGDYRMRLKGLHTLRNLLPTALNVGANTVDMETLLEGDAYNDNRVDVRDVSMLATAYGKSQGQPGFDPRADFNEDGAVDQADLALLRANLGRRGDILVGVAAAAGQEPIAFVPAGPDLTGSVSLRLVPSSTDASIGDVVSIDVMADAGTQPVDAVALHLDFDPAVLEVVDAAGAPATEVEPSMALPAVLLNSVDPARGWVDLMVSSLGGSPASGQFLVARLRFKVLAAESTWVRFSFSDWRPTDVTYQGDSVLRNVEAAEIRSAGGYSLYLPVILK